MGGIGYRLIKYNKGDILGDQCIYLQDSEKIGRQRRACFQCRCGNEFITTIQHVKNLRKIDCGCLNRKQGNNKRHGLTDSPEYRAWCKMKERCYNENIERYPNYGGRGIRVCRRWLYSFENFYEDMGNKPSPQHSLDRIDVNGHYTPENCKWSTRKEQANNMTTNHFLEYNGKKLTVTQWAEELNIPLYIIQGRLRNNWDTVDILTRPIRQRIN